MKIVSSPVSKAVFRMAVRTLVRVVVRAVGQPFSTLQLPPTFFLPSQYVGRNTRIGNLAYSPSSSCAPTRRKVHQKQQREKNTTAFSQVELISTSVPVLITHATRYETRNLKTVTPGSPLAKNYLPASLTVNHIYGEVFKNSPVHAITGCPVQ